MCKRSPGARFLDVLLILVIGLIPVADATAAGRTPIRTSVGSEPPVLVLDGAPSMLVSTSSALTLLRESAGPDTFAIYGGPDRGIEGKFQDTSGAPDFQGWVGVDLTRQPNYWQISTFNAEGLGGAPVGNHAYWCGQSADQVSGWATAPGYGNSWNTSIEWTSPPVSDPSVGRVVPFDFVFRRHLEPGYDFFQVEYDSAGTWMTVGRFDGGAPYYGNGDPAPPEGLWLSASSASPITYAAGRYAGPDGDRVRLRLRVITDGAWSDQDGLWPTGTGAVQVDQISVQLDGVTYAEDHEGPGPYLFSPAPVPFAGDFSDVYANVEDIDPCVDDRSGLVAFVDRGQVVRNGPGVDGRTSTGGSTSRNWDYGIPGGWVVNYTGGLAGGIANGYDVGSIPLYNEVWSPEIDWDLPGPEDDHPDVVGATLRYSAYMHLPLGNGICRIFGVRSKSAGGEWSPWRDFNFYYYDGGLASWRNIEENVTGLLVPSPEKIQISMGIVDASEVFGFPGNDATPGPYIDNVAFLKYRIGGPVVSTRVVDIANDGFPGNGSIDVSTAVARDALDVAFDMARDTNINDQIITTGDSLIVDVKAILPGTTVTDVRMKWALRKNPLFEDALRSAPARAKDQNVVATGPVWTGEVVASVSTSSAGAVIANRYFVDLPDVDLLYPGDELHYYFEASDDGGRVTTLPADLRGFGQWDEYGRSTFDAVWTVNMLPSIRDVSGTQPSKLIVIAEQSNAMRGVSELELALDQLGFVQNVDYDVYRVNGMLSGVSNHVGSTGAHGAAPTQLERYDTIVFDGSWWSTFLLSDGTNVGNNTKSDDLGVLTAWTQLPGLRTGVFFGDGIASAPSSDSSAGGVFVQQILGVQLQDSDVRDELGGLQRPTVLSAHPAFTVALAADGGCPRINAFDSIAPRAGAFVGHRFASGDGSPYVGAAASVIFDRTGQDGSRKVDLTFPFGFEFVVEDHRAGADPSGVPARARLLGEIFDYVGVPSSGGVVTSTTPAAARALSLAVTPNPFNPRATVAFRAPVGERVQVRVFDLRGRHVADLFEGVAGSDEHRLTWDARDQASGVYLVQVRAGDQVRGQKIALVK